MHADGFFQGAMDNASGMATGLEIARFYAAKPRAERPRTMVFLLIPDHHHGEHGRALVHQDLRLEQSGADPESRAHVADAALHVNQDLVTANADQRPALVRERQPGLPAAREDNVPDFNVSVYKRPERAAGGSLGALTPFAPAFHIIDHVIYHTTLDTPELVPAVGLAYSERAFLKILDESHGMTMAELRGTAPLPNPLQ